ncbi:hypothetical protein DMUE_4372 [Dictyocoela muelleri]|nr:hypothetical protein DMUE_4372 [Dictyocoela muelleri]
MNINFIKDSLISNKLKNITYTIEKLFNFHSKSKIEDKTFIEKLIILKDKIQKTVAEIEKMIDEDDFNIKNLEFKELECEESECIELDFKELECKELNSIKYIENITNHNFSGNIILPQKIKNSKYLPKLSDNFKYMFVEHLNHIQFTETLKKLNWNRHSFYNQVLEDEKKILIGDYESVENKIYESRHIIKMNKIAKKDYFENLKYFFPLKNLNLEGCFEFNDFKKMIKIVKFLDFCRGGKIDQAIEFLRFERTGSSENTENKIFNNFNDDENYMRPFLKYLVRKTEDIDYKEKLKNVYRALSYNIINLNTKSRFNLNVLYGIVCLRDIKCKKNIEKIQNFGKSKIKEPENFENELRKKIEESRLNIFNLFCPTCYSFLPNTPFSKRNTSQILCLASGCETNEDNFPRMLENGYLYCEKCVRACNNKVYCVITKKMFDEEPRQCFFM